MTNPRSEWRDTGGQRCLFLLFHGHFSEENARDAMDTICSMADKAEQQITMVWECTGMTGYDTVAREDWQMLIRDIKPKIDSVHLVSASTAIRCWAMGVCAFAGVRITAWDALDQFRGRPWR